MESRLQSARRPSWSSLIMKMDIVSMWESHSVRPPVRTVRLPHTRSKHGRRGWRNISVHFARKSAMSGIFQKRRNLNTIYIGGGTPTTLEADQLDRLLTHLEETFSYEEIKEITVEAGRPDSITREKLEVLKRHKIPRISINPQTMQQKTLDLIGRRHTVEDILRVYGMARELEFENINMDLIAGLPGETVEDVKDTLRQIEELSPDSITVHSLAVKRASRLAQMPELKEAALQEERGRQMEAMIDLAAESAAAEWE